VAEYDDSWNPPAGPTRRIFKPLAALALVLALGCSTQRAPQSWYASWGAYCQVTKLVWGRDCADPLARPPDVADDERSIGDVPDPSGPAKPGHSPHRAPRRADQIPRTGSQLLPFALKPGHSPHRASRRADQILRTGS
jgi:hypothetical protein